mgnify:CR=1 FL=1
MAIEWRGDAKTGVGHARLRDRVRPEELRAFHADHAAAGFGRDAASLLDLTEFVPPEDFDGFVSARLDIARRPRAVAMVTTDLRVMLLCRLLFVRLHLAGLLHESRGAVFADAEGAEGWLRALPLRAN